MCCLLLMTSTFSFMCTSHKFPFLCYLDEFEETKLLIVAISHLLLSMTTQSLHHLLSMETQYLRLCQCQCCLLQKGYSDMHSIFAGIPRSSFVTNLFLSTGKKRGWLHKSLQNAILLSLSLDHGCLNVGLDDVILIPVMNKTEVYVKDTIYLRHVRIN
jgi:hypothetical protein